MHDRGAVRVQRQHRRQRLAPEPDLGVRVVLEDREAVLPRQLHQRGPPGGGQCHAGRVLVVRDDVRELRAYPTGLDELAQLVDVDTVGVEGHLVHVRPEGAQAQQGPVVRGLLHDHVVAWAQHVLEQQRVGL